MREKSERERKRKNEREEKREGKREVRMKEREPGKKERARERGEGGKCLFWEDGPAPVSRPVEILQVFQGCYLFQINSAGQGSGLPPSTNPPQTPD